MRICAIRILHQRATSAGQWRLATDRGNPPDTAIGPTARQTLECVWKETTVARNYPSPLVDSPGFSGRAGNANHRRIPLVRTKRASPGSEQSKREAGGAAPCRRGDSCDRAASLMLKSPPIVTLRFAELMGWRWDGLMLTARVRWGERFSPLAAGPSEGNETAILRKLSTEVERVSKAFFPSQAAVRAQEENTSQNGAARLDHPGLTGGKRNPAVRMAVRGEGGLKTPLPGDLREKGQEAKRTVNRPRSTGAWLPVCWDIHQKESAQHGGFLRAGPSPGAGAERSECDGSTCIISGQ
ncbi:hypothetical protein PABG_07458 [Paracoccidioides brasiliensis Pb03]|nr:hypothetical protein PABG_07458 [Paracoccidioides brasiliensis Pb03]